MFNPNVTLRTFTAGIFRSVLTAPPPADDMSKVTILPSDFLPTYHRWIPVNVSNEDMLASKFVSDEDKLPQRRHILAL